ncbi:hypothetical protein BLOT_010848 [Blomia tropicalis]|nr:hypothetical protein BLOT_010848 [Blomia tropicalis]
MCGILSIVLTTETESMSIQSYSVSKFTHHISSGHLVLEEQYFDPQSTTSNQSSCCFICHGNIYHYLKTLITNWNKRNKEFIDFAVALKQIGNL